ncbi:hypothetical protein [Lederbergia citri]|uniref:SPOR domain-containing protein n=1 Tax=Lederbergia citri TaxID=2833580 RepID=A0A942TE80_9BACI|nr:hypothetical protein [Lederbergia citri]MBS4194829.1 hypothetical protein [Lederbergia citri]
MDNEKGERNSTIKIKLNGREQTFSEETAIHDWQSATKETSAASSEETAEEDFEWVLPNVEKNEVPEYKIINATNDDIRNLPVKTWKKNIKPGFRGLFLSVFLAIAVGLIIGLIIFKTVIQTEDSHVALKETATPPVVEKETKKEMYSLTLPDITIPVLQGGQYSTEEAAVSAGENLSEFGVGKTVIEIEGKYYLFIGVSGDLSTAKSWVSKLKDQGLEEVWAKEISISGNTIELASKEEGDRLKSEINMFPKLAEESTNGYIKGVVSEEVLVESEKAIIGTFNEGLAKNLHSDLETAQKHLKNFQASESARNELLQAQQALLDFVKIYYGKSN